MAPTSTPPLDETHLRRVAHDLRNVLVGLQGIASDLEVRGGAELVPIVEELVATAALANRLSRMLLRPAADVDTAIGCDPTRVLQQARAMIERVAAPFPVDAALEQTPRIGMPSDSLLRVVFNLVRNARNATGPNGVLRVRLRVAIRPERSPARWVELEVDDEADAAAPSDEPGLPGTGLGLAVVRGLVEWAGGTVETFEGAGAGWRTRVRMPALQA